MSADGPAAVIVDSTGANIAEVKGASTAAVAADKALVVAISPNNTPLPVTFSPINAREGVSSGFRILGGATANTLQAMRTTAYTEKAAASQVSISSDNANDTAAGTGAQTVEIAYYDGTGAGPFYEVVTLNGTTPVNTVATNVRFIEGMEVKTVGSVGANVGILTLFAAAGGGGGAVGTIGTGNILIGVGDNRTLWAHHYVANGWTARFSVFVMGIQSGGSGTTGRFFLRSRMPLVANGVEIAIADQVQVVGVFQRSFTFPPTIAGFTQVIAYGIPSVNNAAISAAFDWSEVPT
jgi:hypothetical protein